MAHPHYKEPTKDQLKKIKACLSCPVRPDCVGVRSVQCPLHTSNANRNQYLRKWRANKKQESNAEVM